MNDMRAGLMTKTSHGLSDREICLALFTTSYEPKTASSLTQLVHIFPFNMQTMPMSTLSSLLPLNCHGTDPMWSSTNALSGRPMTKNTALRRTTPNLN